MEFIQKDTLVYVDGYQIFCRWLKGAVKTDRVMVFLHEGLGSVAQWKDFPAQLCQQLGMNALLYDRLGHGLSDDYRNGRPTDYHAYESLVVLPALLNHFHIDQPILFGHSDGGTMALIYAAKNPQSCSAIISEAAHIFIEDITLDGMRQAGRIYKRGKMREALQKYHGVKTDELFYAWHDIWQKEEFRDWNLEPLLPAIQCPVLVIQGTEDQYGSEKQVDGIVQGVGGHAVKCYLDQCGHIPHFQMQERVIAQCQDFLRAVI